MIRKYLLGRTIDAVVITLLMLGSGDVLTFATYLAAATAVVAFLATVGMTKESAQVVHGTHLHRMVVWSVKFLYVAALVMSGSPVVAVFYLTAAVCLRFRAAEVANKESAKA